MIIFFAIFFFFSIFFFIRIKQQNWVVLFILLILIVLTSSNNNLSPDYENYVIHYNKTIANDATSVEPSFKLISHVVHYFFNNILFLFIFYSILGISLKLIAINRLSSFPLTSILLYYSHYFIYQEMIQIRAGIATGFILLSIIHIQKKDFGFFLLFLSLATFFHYSAVFILPFYFLKSDKIQFWYYLLIPIGYIIHFTKIDILFFLSYINFDYLGAKIAQQKIISSKLELNVFNLWQLGRILFSAILLWKWKYLKSKNKYAVICIKFYIFCCFFLVAFSSLQDFAYRISDLFGNVEYILLPFIFYFFKKQNDVFIKLFIIIIGLIFMSITLTSLNFG